MVLFSPEDHRVTSGAPSERRTFLDILLSQADGSYLKNLQDYNRVLRQRNKLLAMIANAEANENDLDAWDDAIIKHAFALLQKRQNFLREISDDLTQTYEQISAGSEPLTAKYRYSDNQQFDDENRFLATLKKLRKKEIILKRTLVGPHRDDVIFRLAQRDVRKHASRGEQKSVLLALKIVEYEYLRKKKNKAPILLLDDLHSELDAQRTNQILNALTTLGQSFITSVEKVENCPEGSVSFEVSAGHIQEVQT